MCQTRIKQDSITITGATASGNVISTDKYCYMMQFQNNHEGLAGSKLKQQTHSTDLSLPFFANTKTTQIQKNHKLLAEVTGVFFSYFYLKQISKLFFDAKGLGMIRAIFRELVPVDLDPLIAHLVSSVRNGLHVVNSIDNSSLFQRC